jgi:hypothetical protein
MRTLPSALVTSMALVGFIAPLNRQAAKHMPGKANKIIKPITHEASMIE